MSTLTHDGSAAPPLRLLIIDDDPDNAASLAMLFHINGYEAEVACCGTAAERAVRRRPDVLVIDLGLPGEDGYAVARRLRPCFAHKPLLVALTGFTAETHRRRSAAEGFDHHLIKPGDPGELLRLLGEHARAPADCNALPVGPSRHKPPWAAGQLTGDVAVPT